MIFAQRHEGNEGISHVDIWGRNLPDIGKTSTKTLRQSMLGPSREE